MTEFWKMSGAGNDFVVFDDSDGSLGDSLTEAFLRDICRRRLSVGADGVLALRGSARGSFSMKYWNRDGRPARMCGNGGRCICVFARLRGAVDSDGPFAFLSDAGEHTGLVTGRDRARIWMTEPVVHYLEGDIDYGGDHRISLVDTGVRHAVLFTRDRSWGEFERMAGSIRMHPGFQPEGVNVDYAVAAGPSSLVIRTFEKGVEAETLACGTGAVAAALCASELFPDEMTLPVDVTVRSGLVLTVGRDDRGWWLEGEARVVYRGFLKASET
jgi:diaminopimelate epimerase